MKAPVIMYYPEYLSSELLAEDKILKIHLKITWHLNQINLKSSLLSASIDSQKSNILELRLSRTSWPNEYLELSCARECCSVCFPLHNVFTKELKSSID